MKKLFFLMVQTLCLTTGFSENPRWKMIDQTPIPARADLDVRWDASTKAIPSKVWVYHLLPNDFSPIVISNVMTLCSFSTNEYTTQNTSGIAFQNPDGSRKLSISFSSGNIEYETPDPLFGPTNLAKEVPPMSRLPELTTDLLKQINIPLSAVTGFFETDKFNLWEPLTMYFVSNTIITNITFRGVNFRRSVDGIPVVACDGGHIYFAEHSHISKLSITWHNLKQYKSFSSLKTKAIVRLLRQGKAIQEPVPMNVGYIDWPNVKSVTIKKAEPLYFAGDTDWLYPFLWLDTDVDTGHGIVDVGIDCPIIDETKP
jgi:hypothetical protein